MNKLYFHRKVKIIYEVYSKEEINIRDTAKRHKISRNTLKKYLNDIITYKETVIDEKNNARSYVTHIQNSNKNFKTYTSLKKYFPKSYDSIVKLNSNRKIEWEKYNDKALKSICYSQFAFYFSRWLKENDLSIKRKPNSLIDLKIIDSDLLILKKWRRSTDRPKWEKAVVLLDLEKGKSITELSAKIERSRRKIIRLAKSYQKGGLDALKPKRKKMNDSMVQNIEAKKSNLIKLIHETPKNFGINRASWDLKNLSKVYFQLNETKISKTTISEYIKSQGYGFQKAKKVLTSPDPSYREKVQKITLILQNLTDNQKFFSVDEFGPFAIKIQGGRSIVKKGEVKIYPQWQKSKGSLICTAGLELSHNQITHFYSNKKNTDEMIKLLEILLFKSILRSKLSYLSDLQ